MAGGGSRRPSPSAAPLTGGGGGPRGEPAEKSSARLLPVGAHRRRDRNATRGDPLLAPLPTRRAPRAARERHKAVAPGLRAAQRPAAICNVVTRIIARRQTPDPTLDTFSGRRPGHEPRAVRPPATPP